MADDDQPVCGHPDTSDPGRCERRVPREGLRCPHHPRTPDELPRPAESRPQSARADGGTVVGVWPSAEESAYVSDPVRTLSDGAGEVDRAE